MHQDVTQKHQYVKARPRVYSVTRILDEWGLTGGIVLMHDLCMATKTISLEIDAYEKLRRAKRGPRESFSSVVRRAQWGDLPPNAAGLLDDLRSLCGQHPEVLLSESTLRGLERRRRTARRRSGWQR